MNNECLFCKIANKELDAKIVYENENVLAFLDINPVNKGHTLVIPKNHSTNIFDIEENDYVEVQKAVQKLAKKIVSALGACGANIIQNNNECAGQVIMHPHIHIIPRFDNDGLKHWPGKPYESEEEMLSVAEKIKSA